jgi:CRP/FNR family transcriptional regulator, cyclic AMP receptor protein
MATDSADVLQRVPLFAQLTPAELAGLSRSLRRRRFKRGEVIFFRGDPGDSLYVLETGKIKIVLTSPDGKEVVLSTLGPTDFFGDLALLDGEPRSADAVATESGELLLLHRSDFLQFLEAHPPVAVRLLAILSRRLRRNAQIIQDAAFLDVSGRLARTLLELAAGHSGQPPLVIRTRLTQTDLAGMVGATRESVNKWLREYDRQGLLHFERGTITIYRPDVLRQLLDEEPQLDSR